jgi:hypothetical protein
LHDQLGDLAGALPVAGVHGMQIVTDETDPDRMIARPELVSVHNARKAEVLGRVQALDVDIHGVTSDMLHFKYSRHLKSAYADYKSHHRVKP